MQSLAMLGGRRRLQQRLPTPVLLMGLGLVALLAWRPRDVPRDVRGSGSGTAFLGAAAIAGETGGEGAQAAPEDPCHALKAEIMGKVWTGVSRWENAAVAGRTIMGFGSQASKLVNRTLAYFDAQVEQRAIGGCAAERAEIEKILKQQLHSVFLLQRSTIEQVLYQNLKKDLLRKMQRKKRELNVKEKLRLLHESMSDYDSQVRELRPAFIENTERDRAEQRLSKLQWGIHELPEAKEMMAKWKMERMRKLGSMRQSKGLAVSLSPGMRLMFRPPGLGNFQVYSRRQVGPPHNLNEVAMGLLNDGDVMDIYNKRASPPLIKFQPTVGIDVSSG